LYYNDDVKRELQLVENNSTEEINKMALNTNTIIK